MRKLTIILLILVTLSVFSFPYILYPSDLLPMPIGWDTPRYVWQMTRVAQDASYVQKNDFYNFVYIAMGAFLVKLGVHAFLVEILLPPILLILLFGEICFLLRKSATSNNWMTYGFLALSWFGAYRVASDLHSNLLALSFLFVSVYFIHAYLQSHLARHFATSVFFITVSSFTHIETTLFLSPIAALSLFLSHKNGNLRRILLVISITTSIVPATLLYYGRIERLASYSSGVLGGRAMSPLAWLIYLGPAGLVGLYALISDHGFFLKMNDFPRLFFALWGVSSVFCGLIQYIIPSLTTFSERAVILFPAPFLVVQKLRSNGHNVASKLTLIRAKLRSYLPPVLAVATILIVLTPMFSTYYVTIDPVAYRKLQWLKQAFPNKSVVLVTDFEDLYAGELGTHINDWAKAVVGDAYAYSGSIYYLRDMMPTPYLQWNSRQISAVLFDDLHSNLPNLDNAVVIYGAEFTDLNPLPNNFKPYMVALENGLNLVNMTKLVDDSMGKYIVPLSQYSRAKGGSWYSTEKYWSDFPRVLEIWSGEVAPIPQVVETIIAVKAGGQYAVNLHYWDAAPTTSLRIQIDSFETQLTYKGLGMPETTTFYKGSLAKGEHLLTITVIGSPTYASLDYLEVIPAGT